MPNTPRKQGYWIVGAAVFVFVMLALPRVALALPCDEHYLVYYSDSSYTTAVGGTGRDCWGHVSQYTWGVQTSHFVVQQCCCNNPDCGSDDYECVPDYWCSDGGTCPSINMCTG
jgi:hypothetical protein